MYSGTGRDHNSPGVTTQALLRMTVEVRGPAPDTTLVRTLTAQTSASRNPGDPQEVTKTLTAYLDASGLADGQYSYAITGSIVQVKQHHHGQNTDPQESVQATSNTLAGTILVDATKPVISDLTPPPDSTIAESQPRSRRPSRIPAAVSSGQRSLWRWTVLK